jgi:hypothetical protein
MRPNAAIAVDQVALDQLVDRGYRLSISKRQTTVTN